MQQINRRMYENLEKELLISLGFDHICILYINHKLIIYHIRILEELVSDSHKMINQQVSSSLLY
jgi:hypothetical protein